MENIWEWVNEEGKIKRKEMEIMDGSGYMKKGS